MYDLPVLSVLTVGRVAMNTYDTKLYFGFRDRDDDDATPPPPRARARRRAADRVF